MLGDVLFYKDPLVFACVNDGKDIDPVSGCDLKTIHVTAHVGEQIVRTVLKKELIRPVGKYHYHLALRLLLNLLTVGTKYDETAVMGLFSPM